MATGGKHAPNRLDRYLEIHATVMSRRRDEGVVLDDWLTLAETDGGYFMSGRIRCLGGLAIDVRKQLRVVSGEGATAMVQTVEYTYHVIVEGIGNLLRYCSPHDDDQHEDHKPYHHKHAYDVLGGDLKGHTEETGDDWPTLGQVIEEARDWYAEHAEQIEAKRNE